MSRCSRSGPRPLFGPSSRWTSKKSERGPNYHDFTRASLLKSIICCRMPRNGFHLRHNECGGDPCDCEGLQRGLHRHLQLRDALQGPAPGHAERRRRRSQGLRMGGLLGQHWVRVRGQQGIRRHGGKGQDHQGEDEPPQQRSRQMGKFLF
jgi:hypothetical protein